MTRAVPKVTRDLLRSPGSPTGSGAPGTQAFPTRAVGPLDFVLTEAHHSSTEERRVQEKAWADVMAAMRAGRHGGDGTAFFQCRTCGRIYGASCEP